MNRILLLAPFLVTAALAQGPLNPPGAPAPTMKTLGEIEARTPISTLPLTITSPGSYYFAGDLTLPPASTAADAITISANDVTIDLGGFSLRSSAGGTGRAIVINSALQGIRIKNGMISGNTIVSVTGNFPNRAWTPTTGGFVNGIVGTNCTGCEFSDLIIQGCRQDGVDLGGFSIIQRVLVRDNGGYGIDTNLDGNTIRDCTAYRNVSTGIYSNNGVMTGCNTGDNGNYGISSQRGIISGCTSRFNNVDGISAVETVVSNCTTNNNGRYGIYAPSGNVNLSRAGTNDQRGIGAADIFIGASGTRYGNFPTP